MLSMHNIPGGIDKVLLLVTGTVRILVKLYFISKSEVLCQLTDIVINKRKSLLIRSPLIPVLYILLVFFVLIGIISN